ncbi:hypothetical protein KC19_6G044000 [Ceratodon purpureus]|uniref:Rhodanese domain-containing protein n=1 Tax=Ceratodon purpureus TaxID=3225 RepID=A0A8T0HEV7_CERPU|nr:hypothetical protein KC19_6G044000 [Ceratodon purpureus]
MEVLSRASVVAAAAGAPAEAGVSGSKNVAVRVNPVGLFLRPVGQFAASVLAAPAALALNYDDYVKKAVEGGPSVSESSGFELPSIELPSFELPSVELPSVDLDGASDFLSANPVALVLGLAAVAVPFVASRAFAGPGASFGSVSAVEAFEKLSSSEQNAVLLDIRAAEDIKAEGSPNLKSIKKTAVRVAYDAEDDSFADKVFAKCKNAESTTVYVLDRFDGSSASVAKLLANSGFKGAYAIKGGSEGPNGWQAKDLPWAMPPKSFNLNIDSLKNIIADGQVGEDAFPTTLGVAAAAVAGAVVLSEAETTLQLLGTVALAQLFLKKFLFAEDRKKTVQEIKTFLDTKIAPKEFIEELKEVGRAILPKDGEVKAAIASGEKVLEKELGVDSVTPEALAEKAKEKLGEEAEKLGVEIPDVKAGVEEVKSAVESAKEKVGEEAEKLGDEIPDIKAGAKEVQSAVESAKEKVGEEAEKLGEEIPDIKAGAEEVKSAVESAKEKVGEEAEKLGEEIPDIKAGAEEVKSAVESAKEKVGEEAEKLGEEIPDVKAGAEEVKSAVESATEEATKSSNGSTAPEPVEEEKPSALPVLLEPPSLPSKTEAETPVAEAETPVVEEPEPSTTAAEVKEVTEEATPFFDSDKEVKPASPFEPVAAAVGSSSSTDSSS